MTHVDLIAQLAAALQQPLPGADAQARMAPVPRREWPHGFNPARIRHAAGLLLLYPIDDVTHLVLTLRSDRVRHSGQVSMPGGVVETGESIEQAALREAREEIALVEPVTLLGPLTPLDIPVSGFRLHPVVGHCGRRPALRAADAEVARILEVPVSGLLNNACFARQRLMRDGRELTAPAFLIEETVTWGATAMVLAEFLTVLGWPGPTNP